MYLDMAPRWWPNRSGHPRPLPLDVWGTVRSLRRDDKGVTVGLEDPAGREVRIGGVDPERGLSDAREGDTLYLFELEATEPRIHHGARIHPRNFREVPPDGGLRLQRARGLQVYRA